MILPSRGTRTFRPESSSILTTEISIRSPGPRGRPPGAPGGTARRNSRALSLSELSRDPRPNGTSGGREPVAAPGALRAPAADGIAAVPDVFAQDEASSASTATIGGTVQTLLPTAVRLPDDADAALVVRLSLHPESCLPRTMAMSFHLHHGQGQFVENRIGLPIGGSGDPERGGAVVTPHVHGHLPAGPQYRVRNHRVAEDQRADGAPSDRLHQREAIGRRSLARSGRHISLLWPPGPSPHGESGSDRFPWLRVRPLLPRKRAERGEGPEGRSGPSRSARADGFAVTFFLAISCFRLRTNYFAGCTCIEVTTFWPPLSSKLALTIAPSLRVSREIFRAGGIVSWVPSSSVTILPEGSTLLIFPSTCIARPAPGAPGGVCGPA